MVDIDIFLQHGSFRTKKFLPLTLFSQYNNNNNVVFYIAQLLDVLRHLCTEALSLDLVIHTELYTQIKAEVTKIRKFRPTSFS